MATTQARVLPNIGPKRSSLLKTNKTPSINNTNARDYKDSPNKRKAPKLPIIHGSSNNISTNTGDRQPQAYQANSKQHSIENNGQSLPNDGNSTLDLPSQARPEKRIRKRSSSKDNEQLFKIQSENNISRVTHILG